MFDPIFVFVYGTLRRGCSNYYLLNTADSDVRGVYTDEEKSEYIGSGNAQGRMYSTGNYPVAVLDDSDSSFVVECFKINSAEIAKQLDRLELPYGYEKSEVTVNVKKEDGSEENVVGYIYHVAVKGRYRGLLTDERRVQDWVKHLRNPRRK